MGFDPVELVPPLARRAARSCALVLASLAGGAVFLITLAASALDVPADLRMLELLAQYLPGYQLSPQGAMRGGLAAFALATLLTFPPALLYYRGVLVEIARQGKRSPPESAPGTAPGDPCAALARIDVGHFAAAFGLLSGGVVALATLWLVIKHRPGEPLGPHLALLGEYLPGYSVSVPGAAIGALEAAVAGAVAFAATGAIYNRLLPGRR